MRTTHFQTGVRETPADLLRRFAGRIGVFESLAGAALDVHELMAASGIACQTDLSPEIALAIRELYADYEDLRAALLEYEWSDPDPEVQAVIA